MLQMNEKLVDSMNKNERKLERRIQIKTAGYFARLEQEHNM